MGYKKITLFAPSDTPFLYANQNISKVDITDVDPVENFETIQNELEVYGRSLEDKRQVLALNKVGAVDVKGAEIQELVNRFREISGGKVFLISAVAGIGLEELKTAIEECELAGCWWKAAQLWFAASTPRGQRAGRELQRALAAISHVPETGASMALESRSITLLLYVTEGACAWICIAVAACSKSKKVWHAPFTADLEHVDRWLCME